MLRFPFTRSNNSKKASTHRVATSDPQTSKEILAKLKERYPKEHFDMKLNWDEDPVIFGSVPFLNWPYHVFSSAFCIIVQTLVMGTVFFIIHLKLSLKKRLGRVFFLTTECVMLLMITKSTKLSTLKKVSVFYNRGFFICFIQFY